MPESEGKKPIKFYGKQAVLSVCALSVLIAAYYAYKLFYYTYSNAQVFGAYNLTKLHDEGASLIPPHDSPMYIDFKDDLITVYDMDKSSGNYSKNFTKQFKGVMVLERDTKHKSRGVMLRAPDLSLWNSSIRFYSCFEDDAGLFTCELLFNASDPTHIVTHDVGVVQANIKFYFPWFKER
jgi:hypothetical protein